MRYPIWPRLILIYLFLTAHVFLAISLSLVAKRTPAFTVRRICTDIKHT